MTECSDWASKGMGGMESVWNLINPSLYFFPEQCPFFTHECISICSFYQKLNSLQTSQVSRTLRGSPGCLFPDAREWYKSSRKSPDHRVSQNQWKRQCEWEMINGREGEREREHENCVVLLQTYALTDDLRLSHQIISSLKWKLAARMKTKSISPSSRPKICIVGLKHHFSVLGRNIYTTILHCVSFKCSWWEFNSSHFYANLK